MDNLNAELCFALRSHNEDIVNLVGTGININIDIHSIAPVIVIRKGNVAKSIYRVASNGNVNGDGKLSKTALQQLVKKIQKQKDFLNGNIKKKSVSKEEVGKLQDIQDSESELVRVGGDYNASYGRVSAGVDCVVVKIPVVRLQMVM